MTQPKSPTQQMSAALKAVLVPELKAAGFGGSFPRYRRDRRDVVDFVNVQYDKEGTAFFLECASHPAGEKMTSWGELVPHDALRLEHAPMEKRARLQREVSGAGSMAVDWFSHAGFGDDAQAYRVLAASVTGLYRQIEAWLARAEIGPNLCPMSAPPGA